MTNTEFTLRKLLKENGSLSLPEFMAVVISNPEAGYYTSKYPIASNTDFITAPEVSQLFGEMIGLWVASTWLSMGSPEFSLVELGPGRGTMMKDVLRATKNIQGFHQAVSIHLIEKSPNLQKIQKEALSLYPHIKINWHEDVRSLPQKPSIIIANEFFDALPIEQYYKNDDHWYETTIELDPHSETICFANSLASNHISDYLNSCYPLLPKGSIIESSTAAMEVLKVISLILNLSGGAALIIDYGYYYQNLSTRQDFNSSLQAIKNHKFHPILKDIGQADLSSLVDFNALSDAASLRGLQVHGPVEQGFFLKAMGIDYRARALISKGTEVDNHQILLGLERLVAKEKMGSLFKVMALTRNDELKIVGFD